MRSNKYLARYTHRVAISNHRLVALEEGQVTFRYKDYADGQRDKVMTLPVEEFLRRFVQHVLPQGFVKIRHYGLLANRQRGQKLALSRQLLLLLSLAALTCASAPLASASPQVDPAVVPCCPQCGGCRFIRLELPKEAGMPLALDRDTS